MGVHDSHSRSYTQTNGDLVITAEQEGWSKEELEKRAARAARIKPSENEVFLPELLDVFRGSHGRIGLKNAMVNLAGLKWTNHEGGIRVPLIVSWPGAVPHGKICHGLVANYDHMATFADLAGVRMPEGKDAVSYRNMLFGKPSGQRGYVVVDHTVITGDGWKLTHKQNKWFLFQISTDPEERRNLAETRKDQLERLQAIYRKEAGIHRKYM